jgi:hypothetical protein
VIAAMAALESGSGMTVRLIWQGRRVICLHPIKRTVDVNEARIPDQTAHSLHPDEDLPVFLKTQ